MTPISDRLRLLRKEEADNFRKFVQQHNGHVSMQQSFTNDEGEQEYFYSEESPVVVNIRYKTGDDLDYFRKVVHEAYIDPDNVLWLIFSIYDGMGDNSFTSWDCEPLSEIEFVPGDLEYLQEKFAAKCKTTYNYVFNEEINNPFEWLTSSQWEWIATYADRKDYATCDDLYNKITGDSPDIPKDEAHLSELQEDYNRRFPLLLADVMTDIAEDIKQGRVIIKQTF